MQRAFVCGTFGYAGRLRLAVTILCLAGAALCGGCARLMEDFNGYNAGAAPSPTPEPTSPADYFLWTKQNVTTIVVDRPGGGRWAQTVPKQVFLADPDQRRPIVYAYTEPVTTTTPARLRGVATLRLDGPGRVFLGLQAVNVQNNAPGSFLGGMLVDVPPLTGPTGVAVAVGSFPVGRIADIYPLTPAGRLQPYPVGSVIVLSWSLDQATRRLTVGSDAPAATAQTVDYPASGDGLSNVPIAKLLVSVWLQSVSSNTSVFLDDLRVEEY